MSTINTAVVECRDKSKILQLDFGTCERKEHETTDWRAKWFDNVAIVEINTAECCCRGSCIDQ